MKSLLSFLVLAISEIASIAFAIYLGSFLFRFPEVSPPAETAVRGAFIFCAICAAYLAVQSGTLALCGVSSTVAMATNILTSFFPVLVIGIAIIDFKRGSLPLSEFKQYAAYFAFGIGLMDVMINAMLMTRLSRRYVGVS